MTKHTCVWAGRILRWPLPGVYILCNLPLECRWNLCTWWGSHSLDYVALCKTLLLQPREGWKSAALLATWKKQTSCCKLSTGATWQRTAAASKSWELFLANSQRENGHLITLPRRNWILPTLWISFKEDPEFQKRTSVWPPLDLILARPWAWPRHNPACLDSWPMRNCETINVYFWETKLMGIWCVAIEN